MQTVCLSCLCNEWKKSKWEGNDTWHNYDTLSLWWHLVADVMFLHVCEEEMVPDPVHQKPAQSKASSWNLLGAGHEDCIILVKNIYGGNYRFQSWKRNLLSWCRAKRHSHVNFQNICSLSENNSNSNCNSSNGKTAITHTKASKHLLWQQQQCAIWNVAPKLHNQQSRCDWWKQNGEKKEITSQNSLTFVCFLF